VNEPDAKYAYERLLKATKDLIPGNTSGNFLITPKGLTITTDDVLPHIIHNFEPSREVLFTFAELEKFSAAYSIEPGWHTTIRKP
jgi:hypothetical protein